MSDEDSILDSELYADLRTAWNGVKSASGAKETTIETAALAGKALWNVAVFSGKFGVKFVKEYPRLVEEHKKKSDRQL
jgi:hypothetical protein